MLSLDEKKIIHDKMIEIKKKLINKKLVHKAKEENVLIYNLRRALSVKIDADIFENVILPKLMKEDKDLLLEYYILHKGSEAYKDSSYYIMYNIPHIINIDYVKDFLDEGKISKDDLKSLYKYYQKDENKEFYVLKKDITEIDEIQIQNILKKRDLQIIDYDNRERISKILDKIDDYKKDDIYFANMFADKEHSYFFEHYVEHVPAMMMIEASRQFLLAICHVFGKIPLKGITFILSGMQVEFNNYLELNFPVKMIAKVNNVKKKRDGTWKSKIDCTVTFYQNNIKAASVNYAGRIITTDSFKVLRKDEHNYKETPRFNPSGMFYNNLSLKDKDNNKYLCKIVDLSTKGFQLEFDKPIFNLETKIFDFYIFFQEIGFVNGKSEMMWYKENLDDLNTMAYRGGFKITDIHDSDIITLKEAIKRFCYIKTEREYL